ncbi:MAG: serine/threonine-protein kinase, partial [Pseudomonadota bacterium]
MSKALSTSLTSPTSPTSPSAAPSAEDGGMLTRGATIGRFVVLGLLGRGGMGEVYAAHDPELDRKIAIKLLRVAGGGDSADGRLRLMREAQAIARVSHPNVVIVYDVGSYRDQVFIAMELVEGHTLNYWRHAAARKWPEILEVFVAAGRGLVAAHERDLVHRDFKPDNVMIGADGQVRVMDFGLVQSLRKGAWDSQHHTAREGATDLPRAAPTVTVTVAATDDILTTRQVFVSGASIHLAATPPNDLLGVELTQAGASLGTPAYMSPEQFRGHPTDARSDQFSFCVALYETL